MTIEEAASVEEHVQRALAFCDRGLDVLKDNGDVEAAAVALEAARTELVAALAEGAE